MTFICEGVQDGAEAVALVDDPEELDVFRHPAVPAAIWRRQPLPSFQKWIDALDPARLPSCRIIVPPNRVHEAVAHICNGAIPEKAERARLVDDIAALADIFARLTAAPLLRLRLDVVTGNACRKFHTDAVTSRLVCTYRGTGTQYGHSVGGADPDQVFTVPTGAPILLRGTLLPSASRSALLHRSPPIEGTGETHLVLVLDPVDDHTETDCTICSTHLRSLSGPMEARATPPHHQNPPTIN